MAVVTRWRVLAGGIAWSLAAGASMADDRMEQDRKAVYDLDVQYQAAVERNVVDTIERIHHKDRVLVLSNGQTKLLGLSTSFAGPFQSPFDLFWTTGEGDPSARTEPKIFLRD